MSRDWKSFELHARKSLCGCEQTIKGDSGKAQKEKRRVLEKVSVSLENIPVILNRMFIDIWVVNANLMRSQMEIKNALLDSVRKIILLLKW